MLEKVLKFLAISIKHKILPAHVHALNPTSEN